MEQRETFKRPREEPANARDGNVSAKRRKTASKTDEALSRVFSEFMSSYLKLNWVNQNEYPHIPPKYVLSDMIMEQFFKQANWRKVADPGSALEYINHCLQHHGMKELESKT